MSRPPSLELYNWHWVSWFLLQDCKFKGQDFTAKEVLGVHEEPLEHQPGLDKHWHHKRKLVRNWGSPTGRASFETIEDLPTVVVQDTSLQGSWPSQTAWWRKSFWTISPWKVPLNACQAIPESHFSGTFLLDRWEGKCRSEKKMAETMVILLNTTFVCQWMMALCQILYVHKDFSFQVGKKRNPWWHTGRRSFQYGGI